MIELTAGITRGSQKWSLVPTPVGLFLLRVSWFHKIGSHLCILLDQPGKGICKEPPTVPVLNESDT